MSPWAITGRCRSSPDKLGFARTDRTITDDFGVLIRCTKPLRQSGRAVTLGGMGIGGVLSAVLVGLVIGYLGRFIAPKRRRGGDIGMILTILIGIVAAVLGTAVSGWLSTDRSIITFAIQLLFSALFVTGFAQVGRSRV